MPKLNVNDATREQLVETAGLRPAVADALLEFRAVHQVVAHGAHIGQA
jgi:hypothetical protein